jgi:hypothetical protein
VCRTLIIRSLKDFNHHKPCESLLGTATQDAELHEDPENPLLLKLHPGYRREREETRAIISR